MKNKYLPYIIFGVPLLIGAFFVYKYVKANKKGESAPPNHEPNDDITPTKPTSGGGGKPTISKYFPLKKGSKGAKVTETQKALLTYDSGILPKFGADGDFGNETMSAVQKVLGKDTIDSQDDINAIIKKASDKTNNEKAKAQKKVAEDNRKSLAKKLIDIYKQSPYVNDFYSIHDTGVTYGYYTSDGRISGEERKVLPKGKKLGLTNKAQFTINWDGYMDIKDGSKYFFISPYGFEVK